MAKAYTVFPGRARHLWRHPALHSRRGPHRPQMGSRTYARRRAGVFNPAGPGYPQGRDLDPRPRTDCSAVKPSTHARSTAGDTDSRLVAPYADFGFVRSGRRAGRNRDPMHVQYGPGYRGVWCKRLTRDSDRFASRKCKRNERGFARVPKDPARAQVCPEPSRIMPGQAKGKNSNCGRVLRQAGHTCRTMPERAACLSAARPGDSVYAQGREPLVAQSGLDGVVQEGIAGAR